MSRSHPVTQRFSRAARAAAAALASAALLALPAVADDDGGRHRGGAWWQWALSIPASVNPLSDATGQHCMVGQEGSVWYLAGLFGGGSASRSCSVPQGAKLFFPIVNAVNFDAPGICGQGASYSVSELRSFSAAFIDSVTQATATLNGRAVRPMRRSRSEVFPVVLPADNLFTALCAPLPVPAAVYPRGVDDGIYAEIEHLPVGQHTLQIVAAAPGFSLNVVYTINVVARDRRH